MGSKPLLVNKILALFIPLGATVYEKGKQGRPNYLRQ
jgi:hypothetical protein